MLEFLGKLFLSLALTMDYSYFALFPVRFLFVSSAFGGNRDFWA